MIEINNEAYLAKVKADIIDRLSKLELLRLIPVRYKLNKSARSFQLTYSFPTIYAIWEGFVQDAFLIYLRAVNDAKLQIDEADDRLLVYSMEIKFPQLKNYPQDDTKRVKFANDAYAYFGKNVLEIKLIINTESNVTFNVINRILESLSLRKIDPYHQFDKNEMYFNYSELEILKKVDSFTSDYRYPIKQELKHFVSEIRNNIAHGNNAITPSNDDFERAILIVRVLMDEVYNRI